MPNTFQTVDISTLSVSRDMSKWADFRTQKDISLRSASVLQNRAAVLAQLLELRTDAVKLNTDHVSQVNLLMQLVNTGLGALKGTSAEDAPYDFPPPAPDTTWTNTGADDFIKRFTAEGVDGTYFVKVAEPADSTTSFKLRITKKQLNDANTQLKLRTDDLGSTNQLDQLGLQTLLGRYNSVFEMVTNYIKKHETQGKAVSANVRT